MTFQLALCTGLIIAQGDLADGHHAERGLGLGQGRLEDKEKQDKDCPRRLEIGIRTGTPPVAQLLLNLDFPCGTWKYSNIPGTWRFCMSWGKVHTSGIKPVCSKKCTNVPMYSLASLGVLHPFSISQCTSESIIGTIMQPLTGVPNQQRNVKPRLSRRSGRPRRPCKDQGS